MAIIKCSECGAEISDKSTACVKCGCPLQSSTSNCGKVIFETSNEFIGLVGKYIIKDQDGNIIARLKSSETYEIDINNDTSYYIRLKGAFGSFKQVKAQKNKINHYYLSLDSFGAGFSVTQI